MYCKFVAKAKSLFPIQANPIPRLVARRLDEYTSPDISSLRITNFDIPDDKFKHPLTNSSLAKLALIMTGREVKIFTDDEYFEGNVFSIFPVEISMVMRFYLVQAFSVYEIIFVTSGKNDSFRKVNDRFLSSLMQFISKYAVKPYKLSITPDIDESTLNIDYYAEDKEVK